MLQVIRIGTKRKGTAVLMLKLTDPHPTNRFLPLALFSPITMFLLSITYASIQPIMNLLKVGWDVNRLQTG